jgi:hypothetical protein
MVAKESLYNTAQTAAGMPVFEIEIVSTLSNYNWIIKFQV